MARHHPFLTDAGKRRMKRAVETVEGRSAAEVVFSVRPASGHYRHIDFAVGAFLAYAGLAFMLFSPALVFSWIAILLIVLVLFATGTLLSVVVSPLRRALAGSKRLSENTLHGARAEFHRLGVSRTRDRSGILVYVSLLEGRCSVLPDFGVMGAVDRAEWTAAAKAVEAVVPKEGVGARGAEALSRAVEGLAPLLEKAMPRRADDINELPDVAEE